MPFNEYERDLTSLIERREEDRRENKDARRKTRLKKSRDRREYDRRGSKAPKHEFIEEQAPERYAIEDEA